MKPLLIALTLLTLPLATPLRADLAPALAMAPNAQIPVERRSHHCNTAAQRSSARCRGV